MKISGMVLVGEYDPYLEYCIDSIKNICDEILIYAHPKANLSILRKKFKTILDGKIKVHYQMNDNIDFSKWRNDCVQKAAGEWILWLDADEIISFSDGTPISRKTVEEMIREFEKKGIKFGLFVTLHFLYNYFTLDASNRIGPPGVHWCMRLFKKTSKAKFYRRIHEYVKIPDNERATITNPIIWHFGHTKGLEDLRAKYARSGKVPDNPYGTRADNDAYCRNHEIFRGRRPTIFYTGPLPKVLRLW